MNQPYYQSGTVQSSKLPSTHLCEFLSKPVIAVIGIFGIAYSVFAVLTGIIASGFFSKILDWAYYSSPAMRGDDTFDTMKAFLSSYLIIIMIVAALLSLVEFIPYLVIYSQSRKGKRPNGAVTVLQVLSILSLVSACQTALLLLFLIFMFILMAATPAFWDGFSSGASADGMAFVLILWIAILAIVCTITLIYAICKVRLAFSVKKCLKDQGTEIKGAKFLGVYNIILAVFQILSIASAIVSIIVLLTVPFTELLGSAADQSAIYLFNSIKGQIAALAVVEIGSTAITAALYIAYAKAAFGIKKHMDAFDGMLPTASPYGYGANYAAAGFNNNGYNNYNGYNGQNYNNSSYENTNNNQGYYQNGYTNTNNNQSYGNENGYSNSNQGYGGENGYNPNYNNYNTGNNNYDESQNNPYSSDNN